MFETLDDADSVVRAEVANVVMLSCQFEGRTMALKLVVLGQRAVDAISPTDVVLSPGHAGSVRHGSVG